MEITPEVAQTMIDSRFHEHPQMKAIVENLNFEETLTQILDFNEVDRTFFDAIKNELTLVLTLYAPLNKLIQNIEATTGLPRVSCENIASLIETLILQPVINDLRAYNFLWQQELAKEIATPQIPEASPDSKERLVLRPKIPVRAPEPNQNDGKPLTREDVMNVLNPSRTMHDDVSSLREKTVDSKDQVVHGYEAYQKIKDENSKTNE